MPPILDVAIGTVFVFLLFSLVVSALNEVILSKLDQRAKFLQKGLAELLGGADHAKKLCEHGLINALSLTNKPSYIPAGAFVTALLDIVTKDLNTQQPALSEANAGLLTKLILDIQNAKAGLPGSFNGPLTTFSNAYNQIDPPPAADSTFGKFAARVTEAAARETAQNDLSGKTDSAEITGIINRQPAGLKQELNALFIQAKGVPEVFQASAQGWFDPQRELSALEGAASGTLALLLRPAVMGSAEAIGACISNLPAPYTKLRQSLLSLFNAAGNDVQKLDRKSVV